MKTDIEQRQYKRFRVLLALYKESKANITTQLALSELAAKNDVKNGFYEEAKQYLHAEGFIRPGSKTDDYSITHEGKKVVEKVLTNPSVRTEHFPSYEDMGI